MKEEEIIEEKQEEKLMGLELINGVFRIRVHSNGETKKEHFEITNSATGFTGGSPFLMTIFRIVPDEGADKIPEGVILEYTYGELKTADGKIPEKDDEIIIENLFMTC